MKQLADVKIVPTEAGSGFEVRLVGAVPFVLPEGARLGEWGEGRLKVAKGLAGDGRTDGARRVIHGLQRALGVSQELHIAGVLAAEAAAMAARVEIGRAKQARAAAERKRVAAMPKVDDRVGFDKDERKALRSAEHLRAQAEEAITRADAAADRKDRTAAATLRKEAMSLKGRAAQELGAARKSHAERVVTRQVEAGVGERRALEADRIGEPVKLKKVDEAEGYKRLTIDGLAAIKWKPSERHLQQALFRYRDMYRSCATGWSSTVRPDSVGGGSGGDAELVRLRMAQRYRLLTEVEVRIAVIGKLHLEVLRAVAGEGMTMREFMGVGGKRAANATQALRRAADKLSELFARP